MSDPFGIAVRPLEPLSGESGADAVAAALGPVLAEHEATTVVVGLPRNMDGSEGPGACRARILAERIQERYPGLTVRLWDERLTTVAAEKTLLAADLSRKRRRRLVDGQAAAILLSDYLRGCNLQDEDRDGGKPFPRRGETMPDEERNDIVVLTDDEGNEVEFLFLDAFEVAGKRYAVLVPLEGSDDEDQEEPDEEYLEGSEAMIFRLEQDENGDEVFVEIEDDEEWAEVTAAWEELQDEDFEDEEDAEDAEEDNKDGPEDEEDEPDWTPRRPS